MGLKKKTTAVQVKTDDETKAPVVRTETVTEAVPVTETEVVPVTETEAVPVAKPEAVPVAKPEAVPVPVEELVKTAPLASDTPPQEFKPTQVAAQSKSPMTLVAAGEEEGFEGLEVGFFSYPTIKLPSSGKFETSSAVVLGSSFRAKILGSRGKLLIKPKDAPAKDKRCNYSYDGVTLIDGRLVTELKEEWDAPALETKKYLEVTAITIDTDEGGEDFKNKMVMLSISPSGIQRFSGYFGELKFLGKGNIKEVITNCKVGAKVTSGSDDFYPWEFEFHSQG